MCRVGLYSSRVARHSAAATRLGLEHPHIDTYIGNLATAVEKSVALFEQRITPEPAHAAAAARAYIAAKRAEMKALRDHTYGSNAGDGTATDAALARLNQICGTTAN